MGKTLEFKQKPPPPEPRTDLAAEVLPKLEAARARLAELEGLASAAALADALDEAGAAGRLAQVNSQVGAARRDVTQLESAHRLALQRDAIARAAIEAKGRQAQLAALEAVAAERLEAMAEVCAALETAAKAYGRFLDITKQMAVTLPTGVIAHAIAWDWLDTMVEGRGFPAPIPKIVASEMFRHAPRDEEGRRHFLPGASPLIELFRFQSEVIEPATESVRRRDQYIVGAIRERFAAIEAADAARFGKTA